MGWGQIGGQSRQQCHSRPIVAVHWPFQCCGAASPNRTSADAAALGDFQNIPAIRTRVKRPLRFHPSFHQSCASCPLCGPICELKWSWFLGQICGLAKMYQVSVYATFRISAWLGAPCGCQRNSPIHIRLSLGLKSPSIASTNLGAPHSNAEKPD
jgi:hypothetical protein